MKYSFEKLSDEHRNPVIDIFNYYIENSFAAYPGSKVSYDFFDMFLYVSRGYPAIAVRSDSGDIVGFAFLRAYHPMDTFKRAAEISYFVMPEHTRKGIGRAILAHLIEEAKKLGIDSILADISSLNRASIVFHSRNGFRECGRLKRVGRKFDRDFDVVWMQKTI